MFACSGESLTRRLRAKAYETMLCQEVAWYDRAENNTGALTTRLSTDASAVQSVSDNSIQVLYTLFHKINLSSLLAFESEQLWKPWPT